MTGALEIALCALFAKFITLYMFLIWKVMVYWKGIPVELVRIYLQFTNTASAGFSPSFGVSCGKCVLERSLDVEGKSRFRFNAATADIAKRMLNLFSKHLLRKISCFHCRSDKGVSHLQSAYKTSWRTVSLMWCRHRSPEKDGGVVGLGSFRAFHCE